VDKKRILLWLGAAGVGAAALAQLSPAESPVSEPARARQSTPAVTGPASERFASLPLREAIGKARGELFGPRSWEPAAKSVPRRPGAQAPEQPVAPPIPYRVAGQVVSENGMRVVLAKGDRVFEVRQGETLEGGFRVETIEPHSVTFLYVPLGLKQELAVAGAGLDLPAGQRVAGVMQPAPHASPQQAPAQTQPTPDAAPRTAQLRFAGPQQVRTGAPFDVALKLTSPQPVRAMPMQLSYDAKRLEPLAVRAGELFAGGNFTYRVNPSGSIFVGASGSGRAAADTDSLIVTFRPIASGPAELRVSSLLLQGAAGGTIAHEPPQAFHAAIVQ
jgi:hypothetical protein